MRLRAKTLAELRDTLDNSYFTSASFRVKNTPDGFPFLDIEFGPAPTFFFRVYESEDGACRTEESPGKLIASADEITYKNLEAALSAVRNWTRRIREEYTHAAALRTEVDDFIEQFRSRVFAAADEDPAAEFSADEISEIRNNLDRLTELVAAQAETLKANSYQIEAFEKEIEKIKEDLNGMPRGVWKAVASNKLLKSIKNFLGTPEGRALISDGLKKLIGM
jgi:hypothetical protein